MASDAALCQLKRRFPEKSRNVLKATVYNSTNCVCLRVIRLWEILYNGPTRPKLHFSVHICFPSENVIKITGEVPGNTDVRQTDQHRCQLCFDCVTFIQRTTQIVSVPENLKLMLTCAM